MTSFTAAPTLPRPEGIRFDNFKGSGRKRVLRTNGYNGFSVKYSPFQAGRIACGGGVNFGMKGPGQMYVFDGDKEILESSIDLPDAIFDVCWNEKNANQVLGACANGIVYLWDTVGKRISWTSRKEHTREVNSIDWNLVGKELVLSSGWDGVIKVWHPISGRNESVDTIGGMGSAVYQACWSPRDSNVFVSVGADAKINLWDLRANQKKVTEIINAHENEILTVDWNKYNPMTIATGSVDLSIRLWDLRKNQPITKDMMLNGHYRAVRRVKFSPFSGNELASVGYDMTVRRWDLSQLNHLVELDEDHTEFVTGLDYSLFRKDELCTCSWDETIFIK